MLARRLAATAVVVACAGCSLDWSYTVADGGARDGAAQDGRADQDGGRVDASASCLATADCPLGSVCHFPDHLCGTGQPGSCRAVRTQCASDPNVCTCDGVVDKNECAANGRGQDVATQAGCTSAAFAYQCGYVYCVTGTPAFSEFCVRQNRSGEDIYHCENSASYSCSAVACTGCDYHGCTCSTLTGGALLDCP